MAKEIRNLTDDDIEAVCRIIDGWSRDAKLTWDSLIEAIEKRLFRTWSRQALDRHKNIKQAYLLKKKSLQRSAPNVNNDDHIPADLKKVQERIRRLESEIERLNMENHNLREQFILWSANATAKGVTDDLLNKPLSEGNHRSTRDDR